MQVKVTEIFRHEKFWGVKLFELFPVPYKIGDILELEPTNHTTPEDRSRICPDTKGVSYNLLGEPISLRVCTKHPGFGLVLLYQVYLKAI